jgi:hypothetical protein
MVVYRVVPMDFAFINKSCQRCRGECFGIRADPEERVLVHGCGFPKLAYAIALGDHYLSVFHDSQRDSRNVEGLHGTRNVVVQIGWRAVLRSHRYCHKHKQR